MSAVFVSASPAHAQAVQLNAIAPTAASYGESVTIAGNGFGGPNIEIRVGGVVAPVVSATGSRATFRVPTGVPIGPTTITATNPGGRTGSIRFDLSGTVTLTLDEAHRAQAIVGAGGGVLAASSNGRTYTLTIPPGALARDEAIVLTPIATMAGLPLDRLLGAAHFAPEGLQFAKPAELAISLAPGADTHGFATFSAAGNGGNLHLVPFTTTESGVIRVAVPHFSVAGAGGGSAAATSVIGCQQATLECTYLNAIARAQQLAAQSVCGTDCATPAELADHIAAISQAQYNAIVPQLRAWFSNVIDPLNVAGAVDDVGLVSAGHEYEAWRGWVNASALVCYGFATCADIPEIAADIEIGDQALGADYRAAFERAHDACNDLRVADLIADVEQLTLLNQGGLPADELGLKHEFACQLVISAALPAAVHLGDTVPFDVSVGVRTGGPAGPIAPQANVGTSIQISDGCGLIGGATRSKTGTTDATGTMANQIQIMLPCVGTSDATEVTVSVGDIQDAGGALVALGRTDRYRTAIHIVVTVSPANAIVAAGGTISFSAQVQGGGPLVTWTGTGGSIPPGPSSSATFTAGSTIGIFSVTATSVDDPSQSQTVAVQVTGAQVTVNPSTATLSKGAQRQFGATVTGIADQRVTWTATGGSITSGGLYTAGLTTGTFHVRANSLAAPAAFAEATVTIVGGVTLAGDLTKTTGETSEDGTSHDEFHGSYHVALEVGLDGRLTPTAAAGTASASGFSVNVCSNDDGSAGTVVSTFSFTGTVTHAVLLDPLNPGTLQLKGPVTSTWKLQNGGSCELITVTKTDVDNEVDFLQGTPIVQNGILQSIDFNTSGSTSTSQFQVTGQLVRQP